MKTTFILPFVFLVLSALPSPGVTLTVKIDKTGMPHLLRDNEEIKSGSSYLLIKKGDIIKLALINGSKRNVHINIKQPDGKQVVIDTIVFKIFNPISTDENLNLKIRNQSISLDKQFSLFFSTDPPAGEEEVFSIDFEIIRMGDTDKPANTSQVPSAIDLYSGELKSDVDKRKKDYQPGCLVYDAFKLSDKAGISEYEFKKIIKFYYPDLTIDDINKAKAAVSDNPFLNKIINENYEPGKVNRAEAEAGGEILSSLSLSSIGGLDVTNIADGLAKFLVKRTRQELSMAFFDKFKKLLDDPKYMDLKTVFPATYSLLAAIGDNIYDYQQYIQNLREAFKSDIDNLNENLPGIIPNHEIFFDQHHAFAASLKSGCYIASDLQKQVHPGDIVANYPLDYLSKESKNWSGSIQTLQLLSASLRDTSSADSAYWVKIKYIRQLVNDKRAFTIYLGLLYQEAIQNYDGVQFEKTTLVQIFDVLSSHFNYYDAYKIFILGFAERTEALNKMIKSYSKPANDSMAVELYAKYFSATVDMIEYCTRVGTLPYLDEHPFLNSLSDTLAIYFDLAYSTTDLVTDINRRNYSSAINHLVHIYDVVINSPLKEKLDAIKVFSITKKEYDEAAKKYVSDSNKIAGLHKSASNDAEATQYLVQLKKDTSGFHHIKILFLSSAANDEKLKAVYDSLNKSSDVVKKLVQYGSFMATIATAKNSDDVQNAIESAALPSGSSRVKRETAFNVSLNGYLGLYSGYEKIKGIDEPYQFKLDKQWNSFGITAPIGIAASMGSRKFFWLGNDKRCHWSYSLFISAIDIGAVAAFRFKDTVTSQVPTIQLKDLVSPGAFLSIGIPKSPLSLNFGAQAGPNLRKVNLPPDENNSNPYNDYSNKIYWRYSVSLCVDIPIINFYTKSRN